MADNAKTLIEKFLHTLTEVAVEKVLPKVAALIPGVPGALVAAFLQRPEILAKVVAAAEKGEDFVVEFLAREVDVLKAEIEAHVHGNLKTVVDAVLNASPPGAVNLDADEVRLLALLTAAGDLKGALRKLAQDLGLLPKAA